ncbi:MAG: hypothetical protein PHV97_00180 [Candidatus Omnitrophica bacterium]|nr:hypothetical protein [Candidatus Omnitrophota bacterium]
MKKIMLAVLMLSLLISVPAFAGETKKEETPGVALDNSKGMPMPGMGRRGYSMMGQTQMVATDEGGVIVLMGNKLSKYDADLDLVKEVEVKMPMGPMGDKQCPMMGKASAPAAESSEKKS